MAKIWEYGGFTIDEGLKPHDGNFKPDFYQYFFLVKKDGQRIMKYCVWAPKDRIEEFEPVRSFLARGGRPEEFIRAEGLKRVKERIDSGVFENTLLEITPEGMGELPLDKLAEKKT